MQVFHKNEDASKWGVPSLFMEIEIIKNKLK